MRSKSHVQSAKNALGKRKAPAAKAAGKTGAAKAPAAKALTGKTSTTKALAAAPKVHALPETKKAPALAAAANPPPSEDAREAVLARVESVRLVQREEGNFDCFGRAEQGFCDQGECTYHAECLSVSRLLHDM